MDVIISPVGSHGDVHPFLGLALALRSRGHRVTFLLVEHFGPLVRSLGFESVPLGDDHKYEETMRDPDLWHPRRSFPIVARTVIEASRRVYRLIEERHVPGETVLVGGTLSMGVRLAQEKLGIPAATVHLQPGILYSSYQTPAFPDFETPSWWPAWFRRLFFRMIYRKVLDPAIAPGLNQFRAELGLPPVKLVMMDWLHSPQLVLNFFPEWYGPIQPDWPKNAIDVGFPLFDEREVTPIEPGLEAFLDAGTPPIAFTPGSANLHGRPFFDAAVDACGRLGRRGLLLTRFAEQVPPDLPPGVKHVPFVPFSLLLPRVAALVHHGGIGTASQGMAAGIPQLIMPLAHDQPDNADRMKRLGIARDLPPARFKGPAVAEALRSLLDNPEVARNCRAVAARFADDPHPMEKACDAIERLMAEKGTSVLR